MGIHHIKRTIMTGGIGFSKLGQNSNQYNRSLQRSGSKRNKFSFVGSKINNMVKVLTNYTEIQAWKNNKLKRENSLSRLIYAVLIFIAVCVSVVVLFIQR
jgi:hypothetical protein